MWRHLIFATLLASAGCKPAQQMSCPIEGTKLTYESFGAGFMGTYCQNCHGQAEGDRKGAPPNFYFSSAPAVRDQRDRIFARAAGSTDSMPPGPDDTPEEEREKLAEWLSCGAP